MAEERPKSDPVPHQRHVHELPALGESHPALAELVRRALLEISQMEEIEAGIKQVSERLAGLTPPPRSPEEPK